MSLRIVFFGTPDFAVSTLDALHQSHHDIVGVVTATDKLGGRGKKQILMSDVKTYALEKSIPILQPKNLKSKEFQDELRAFNADLQVIVAFRMLPEAVWSMPPLGTMNLHGSLLPKYRGAAPINWAIIRGEKETGVTTFLLKHAIDTGDLLGQKKMPIDYKDTAGTLYNKMKSIGAELVLESVDAIETKTYSAVPQNPDYVTNAPKIYKDTCKINFHKSTRDVYNFIRGLSPYPGAYMPWSNQSTLKILDCDEIVLPECHPPGKVSIENEALLIYTIDGAISPKEIQVSGKRRMSIKDYLNGNPILPD